MTEAAPDTPINHEMLPSEMVFKCRWLDDITNTSNVTRVLFAPIPLH